MMESSRREAHQQNAISEAVRKRNVERHDDSWINELGISPDAADQVVQIGRDEALLDAIRASHVRPEHVRMLQLSRPDFSVAEARRRIVRAMEIWDCQPFDAVRCLIAHLVRTE